MKPRFPVWPTIIVLAAVMTMIALGVWQLQRKAWKESLIARYALAAEQTDEVPWPRKDADVPAALYRRSHLTCESVLGVTAVSGRSAVGDPGLAPTATCKIGEKGEAQVVLGWSREPIDVDWKGGEVHGIVTSGAEGKARLIADPPTPGLQPLARPDPRDLPNNHLAYAVQWFVFAGIALVIYVLAVAKRLAGPSPRR
ncbi:SURF1 family protein [Novosphingobium sp. KCTC 2891]|uniref:SURF1 family cytochrome oxidase biogenesis protein n=1 Tax=Novosphingobium sp. KCTC 2891 TaxID=2989730 RepID=UPI0022231D4F|nr:SURF1 family cytochrome oxidase biogenesis protein [Novosphingobium sp. KCTC 2891]MCW1382574.1 SURF1 family protein [Novosphingobium sp. KCTC 2891]